MTSALDEFRTPGQFLQYLLETRGWTQRILALVLGVDETGLSKIITGKRALDARMALSLSQIFGIPPEKFLELQTKFDLAMARVIVRPDPELSKRASLLGDLPVSDMIRRGWLKGITDIRNPQLESALCDFFGVSSVDDIEILPHAAKKTDVASPASPAQLAWLYQSG